MNILIFSWRGPGHPNAGGAEIVTHEHAKVWVKAGHKVTLFTSSYKYAKPFEVIDGVEIVRKGSDILEVQINAFFWYVFNKHREYDLVIDHFHGLPFFTPIFVWTKKIAFINEVAKEVWKLNPWPKPFNLLPAVLGPLMEPLMFKYLYHRVYFLTASNSTKLELINLGITERNITTIPHGIKVINPDKTIKKNSRKTLIYLGALSKDKGIEDAIIAFLDILRTTREDWQFWVVGRGTISYVTSLQEQVITLGIEKKVEFFGFVDERKKFELLKRAHVLIHPSIREGWGLNVIEAAAMGTPTVGYNVPGLRDSIRHNVTGILCTLDPKQCSKEVVKLTNNISFYKMLQKNGIEWSNQFSWHDSTKKSLRFIEDFIKT